MSQNVGTLRAILGLDSNRFKRGLKQSRGAASTFVAGMRRIFAPLAAAAAAAFTVRGIKNTLGQVDAQAKLARSLGTTTQSMQVLARAGELAGVSMQRIEQGSKDLFRRLSQAASGGGPAADALKRLQISASELLALPLDQRLAEVNDRINKFVPAAQRAAVAGALFGEEGAIVMTRLDPTVIAQATAELERFGYAISDVEAGQVEAANDAMSSLGLVMSGLKTRISVALAPALQGLADGLAALLAKGAPLRVMLEGLGRNLSFLFTISRDLTTIVRGLAVELGGLAKNVGVTGDQMSSLLGYLKGSITFIPKMITGLASTISFFARLIRQAGGFSEAMQLLVPVASEVLDRIKRGFSLLGEQTSGVGMSISAAFASAFAAVVGKFADMTGALADGWNSLMSSFGIESNARGLGSALADRLRGDADYMAGAANAFQNSLLSAWADLRAPLDSLELLKSKIAETGEEAKTALDDAASAATGMGDAANTAGGSGAAAVDKIGKAAKDAKPAVNGMRDSFKQMFTSAAAGASSLKDVLSQLLSKLAEMAASSAFEALFPKSGQQKSGGGFFKSLLGTIIPGFASGTNSAPGGLALVGERGRELINLPRAAQVIPNGRTESLLKAAGGGMDRLHVSVGFDQNANLMAVITDAAGREMARSAPQIIGQAVGRSMERMQGTKAGSLRAGGIA